MPAVRSIAAVNGPSVDQAMQQQALAQALQQRALQPNIPANGGPVQAQYGPGNALVDLANSLAASWNLKQANSGVEKAKNSESQTRANAIDDYQNSVPDAQVGAEAQRRINAAPADQLPEPVVPRSEATRNLSNAFGPQMQSQLAAALLQRDMAQKPAEAYTLAPDAKRFDANNREIAANPKPPTASKPEAPLDELAKLNADLKAGRISQADYTARRTLMTTRAPNAITMMQSPDMQDALQARAKAIASYDLAPPAGLGSNNPATQQLFKMVLQENPNYNQNEYTSRQAAMKRWSTTNADRVESLNAATQHLGVMAEAIPALKNGDMQMLNKIGNAIGVQFGQDPATNFNIIRDMATNEINRLTLGGHMAEADREKLQKNISSSGSPEQLQGALEQLSKLMGGRVSAMRKNYESSTKRKDFDSMLEPNAIAFEQKYGGAGNVTPSSSGSAPPPTNAKGWVLHQDAQGNKAYVSPDGKQYEVAQ